MLQRQNNVNIVRSGPDTKTGPYFYFGKLICRVGGAWRNPPIWPPDYRMVGSARLHHLTCCQFFM